MTQACGCHAILAEVIPRPVLGDAPLPRDWVKVTEWLFDESENSRFST